MNEKKLERRKKIQKARYSLNELAALSRIADSPDYQVLKRIVFRYIRNLRDLSFKLPEENASYLQVRHAELVGRGLGARQLISIIDNASKKYEDLEETIDRIKG